MGKLFQLDELGGRVDSNRLTLPNKYIDVVIESSSIAYSGLSQREILK